MHCPPCACRQASRRWRYSAGRKPCLSRRAAWEALAGKLAQGWKPPSEAAADAPLAGGGMLAGAMSQPIAPDGPASTDWASFPARPLRWVSEKRWGAVSDLASTLTPSAFCMQWRLRRQSSMGLNERNADLPRHSDGGRAQEGTKRIAMHCCSTKSATLLLHTHRYPCMSMLLRHHQ